MKLGRVAVASSWWISRKSKVISILFSRFISMPVIARVTVQVDFIQVGFQLKLKRNFLLIFYFVLPANNHAYIQSFLHHKNKESIPNVCCSAQRLVDMEVLHVAPDDPQTLKVTTLKKMRVMKCSCGWTSRVSTLGSTNTHDFSQGAGRLTSRVFFGLIDTWNHKDWKESFSSSVAFTWNVNFRIWTRRN